MSKITVQEAAAALYSMNVEAAKDNGQRRAGKMFNDKVLGMVRPKLPALVRGYADESWFQFAIINATALAAVKFAPENRKLAWVTEAAVRAVNDDFIGSLNIEGMIEDILSTIPNMPAVIGEEVQDG